MHNIYCNGTMAHRLGSKNMEGSHTYEETDLSSDGLCARCLDYLNPPDKEEEKLAANTKTKLSTCPICLGIWQDGTEFQARIEESIKKMVKPYGGNDRFSFEKDSPVVSLPGDIVCRYQLVSLLMPAKCKDAKPVHVFLRDMKEHVNSILGRCIEKLQEGQSIDRKWEDFPSFVNKEEQGYLALHLLLAPSKAVPRPTKDFLPHDKSKKNRRKQYETQGGHPRSNLERTLQRDGTTIWPVSQAVEICKRQKILGSSDTDWFFASGTETRSIQCLSLKRKDAIDIHIALWRRPFLVQGNYTKARRDVSQTPFYINSADNPKKRQRLGVSSVEEQILPVVAKFCGGISTYNNSPDDDNVMYGKAKFHASGREDMDVRMILPKLSDGMNDKKISGRPFCCEVIDALRMPSIEDLKQIVDSINHTEVEGSTATTSDASFLPVSNQYYGRNPLGVGVDPTTFSFCPKGTFSNLQAETEQKHKYYGCLCWSQEILPSQNELTRRLKTSPDGETLFPLELKQRTPIRVLHRRANAVRIRHIISCPLVERLDDHYFRLHISTDAGTYVKEFCHGDLGRTQPNVSTLLECGKVDILELDCEGIQNN